ncbi:uncharacterized protein LOC134226334 [Armigeres subalbatus]|uniref:uncharacterized protein LOC134226334 n=1 Tax=Armigeres subalbatus TaxID=124917 RepID=UPI002ED1B1DC
MDGNFDQDNFTQFLREGVDYEIVDVDDTLISEQLFDTEHQTQPKRKKPQIVELAELPRTPDQKKYRFKGVFIARNFKGQKHGENVGELLITADSTDEVVKQTWDFTSKFLQREVFFRYPQSTASSSTDLELCVKESEPSFEDFDKFVLFSDKISKRYYTPSSLTSNMLHSWYNKDVNIFIYRYSVAVTSSQQWDKVKAKQLKPSNPDRSGAPSNVNLFETVAELKEAHREHYVSDDINWSIWATYILKQPEHLRTRLIASGPPDTMVRLFRPVPIHPDSILVKTKQELKVARNVVDFFDDELKDLRTCTDSLKTLTQQIDGRIWAMEKKVSEYRKLLNSVSEAVSPEESSFSKSVAEEITDCVDVDHN